MPPEAAGEAAHFRALESLFDHQPDEHERNDVHEAAERESEPEAERGRHESPNHRANGL